MEMAYPVPFKNVSTFLLSKHHFTFRMRAMITILHRDAKHGAEGRDDHRSRLDV